jgi:hydroxyacylglutathione hydrolase
MPYSPPIRISFGIVNAYLLKGTKGDVLIDTGLPGLAPRLLRALEHGGTSPDRLALIILTHVHFDHIGGLSRLRRQRATPILVHRLEAPLLQSGSISLPVGQTPLARLMMGAGAPFARRMRFAPIAPDIIADDDLSLQPFGIDGRILHTPGHTRGSISVLLNTGDAVIGDLCQNGWGFGMGLGRIVPPLADVPEALAASWDRLLQSGAKRLYPGHGMPFAIETLRAIRGKLAPTP